MTPAGHGILNVRSCIIASIYAIEPGNDYLNIQYKIAINTVGYWGGAHAPYVLWFRYSRRDPAAAGPYPQTVSYLDVFNVKGSADVR